MDRARSHKDAQIDGMMANLPVATTDGWRLAASLQRGDMVLCLDAPPQRISGVRHHTLNRPHAVMIPVAALGNRVAIPLLPDQAIALDLDQAAELYGDPVALIPIRALVGWRRISRCRAPAGPVVRLHFARSQVIYAGPGLLLGCPGDGSLPMDGPPAPPLTAEQAVHLMACVMAQEVGAALRPRCQAAF